MAEVSLKLEDARRKRGWTVERAAKELGISRASFYNYRRKVDLPRFEVLEKAREEWNVTFEHLDKVVLRTRPKRSPPLEVQLTLPFIQALREQDVEVVKVTAKKPNAVELRLLIRFAS
jgi:transcriptional regulator with XRE-family HTH domain